jgi:hypothetical protein
MLDILEERLIEGLTITKVKETNTKYIVTFLYENNSAKAELAKSCTPGHYAELADRTIITAMSTICFNRGDYYQAKFWLDKLTTN